MVRRTHLCLVSHKMDLGKQCRPRSDAADCGIYSGSKLFAFRTEISIKHNNNKNEPDILYIEMNMSEELR